MYYNNKLKLKQLNTKNYIDTKRKTKTNKNDMHNKITLRNDN